MQPLTNRFSALICFFMYWGRRLKISTALNPKKSKSPLFSRTEEYQRWERIAMWQGPRFRWSSQSKMASSKKWCTYRKTPWVHLPKLHHWATPLMTTWQPYPPHVDDISLFRGHRTVPYRCYPGTLVRRWSLRPCCPSFVWIYCSSPHYLSRATNWSG